MTIFFETGPGPQRPLYYVCWGILPGLTALAWGYLLQDKGLYGNFAVVLWGMFALAPFMCMNLLVSLWIIFVRRVTRIQALFALWSLTLIGLPLGAAAGVLHGLIR